MNVHQDLTEWTHGFHTLALITCKVCKVVTWLVGVGFLLLEHNFTIFTLLSPLEDIETTSEYL